MKDTAQPPLELRPPAQVMTLARLGALHQTRLSFMRILTRRMAREGWRVTRGTWRVDDAGVGHAVYTAEGPHRSYSLVAFAHDLPPERRSDRVIAEAWDATFTLFDGVPTPADIDRLSRNVPYQEAGRLTERELTLSRANRSARVWDHVVQCLAQGHQPEAADLRRVGYVMRTTAVYGSGKFGAADREVIADRPELAAPFQTEMLTVYLIRCFVRDLLNHMGQAKGGDGAVDLAPEAARALGIGNSTGLGMAPFLINHPGLLHNWIQARETAIARIRALPRASEDEFRLFRALLSRTRADVARWDSQHPRQVRRVAQLARDLCWLEAQLDATNLLDGPTPWKALSDLGDRLSPEAAEAIRSLMLEPYPDLVDDLEHDLACPEDGTDEVDGTMTLGALQGLLHRAYDWALALDWSQADASARVWYVSEEKLEPRLGERAQEPVAPYEQPLAPARDAVALCRDVADQPAQQTVADFLLDHPQHRAAVRRAQLLDRAPYGEIRDNTIGASLMPIDMLRAKLSFFGATRFDPRSDRWVRICMFAGAPYPEDLASHDADRWVYPAQ